MKSRIIRGALLFGGALVACLGVASLGSTVEANPPGIPFGLQKAYQFNLIGRPNEFNGQCGRGGRIFVERDAHHAHVIILDDDSGWYIGECNGTGNNRAELYTDEVGDYVVFARILGKPGGSLDICVDTLEDHDSGEHLCEIGSFSLKRYGRKTNFSMAPSEIFDAELEDLIWNVDTNKDYRITQFRVYKWVD